MSVATLNAEFANYVRALAAKPQADGDPPKHRDPGLLQLQGKLRTLLRRQSVCHIHPDHARAAGTEGGIHSPGWGFHAQGCRRSTRLRQPRSRRNSREATGWTSPAGWWIATIL